jgi:hypothetical protein
MPVEHLILGTSPTSTGVAIPGTFGRRAVYAYFDESGHVAQPGYYGMAGFVGSADQWTDLNREWVSALSSVGCRTFHMVDFAASRGEFVGWDEARRRKLMQGLVKAVKSADLTAIAATIKMEDYNALTSEQRGYLVDPYYACLQELLHGFALTAVEAPADWVSLVVGSRQNEYEAGARRLWNTLKKNRTDPPYSRLDFFAYDDMRFIPGLQAADLLAYEATKELSNQDKRPDLKMRWPLDEILTHQARRERMLVKHMTKAYLEVQADGLFDERGVDVVEDSIDEMLRMYRVD